MLAIGEYIIARCSSQCGRCRWVIEVIGPRMEPSDPGPGDVPLGVEDREDRVFQRGPEALSQGLDLYGL